MKDFQSEIIKQIKENISLNNMVIEKNIESINVLANKIINAYKENKKVLWMGNGGSAADAQHLSCELVGKFYKKRKALNSVAFTTNTSLLTSISNDYDYINIFERQVEAHAEKGDILIGISTSGKSKNIIKAFEKGLRIGTVNAAFVGNYINDIKNLAGPIISIPSNDTPRIQESHIMVGHIICYLVENEFFGD